MARLGDRLDRLHRLQFVGRDKEVSLFCRALCAERLPFAVLYVVAPAGAGKTLLLKRFMACCTEAGIPGAYLDGRTMEPSAAGLEQALNAATAALAADQQATFNTEPDAARRVLFLDSYEALIGQDAWLRDVFLPQLPEDVLVVIAGREEAPLGWRADIGWQALCTILSLNSFDPEESRAYLIGRGVPERHHQDILDFTKGHALALALVADRFAQPGSIDFAAGAPLDIVHTLLDQFVPDLPGPLHRAALEACAVAGVLTEPLLVQLVAVPEGDADGLFAWLRSLSFVEAMPCGLMMHDITREVLLTDLRWRNPSRFVLLHDRARSAGLQSIRNAPPPVQQAAEQADETHAPVGRSGYDLAVKNALRVYACPERLRGNPLLYSRLVAKRVGWEEDDLCRIEALRSLIQEVAAHAFMSPRDAKLYRALELASFSPMPSQEKAAERMDVSFATFRRYLKTAVERLTESLWQREISSERK